MRNLLIGQRFLTRTESRKHSLIHTFIFITLAMPFGAWTGRTQAEKFSFRDDPSWKSKDTVESSLKIIHDISTENIGELCINKLYSTIKIPLNTERYDGARQKSDLASVTLQDLGFNRHSGLLDALARGLLTTDPYVVNARILATNLSTGFLSTSVWWTKIGIRELGEPVRLEEDGIAIGAKPYADYPWFEDPVTTPSLRSPKFASAPKSLSFKGWWTYPYYSCAQRKWILSYSIAIAPIKHPDLRGFLSIDIDITELYINQCDLNNPFYSDSRYSNFRNNKFSLSQNHYQQYFINQLLSLQTSSTLNIDFEIEAFHNSHKCHHDSMDCQFSPQYYMNNRPSTINGWTRGSYQCLCKQGFYSIRHPEGYNGTIMEVSFEEYLSNTSTFYVDSFVCMPCMEGCTSCQNATPCLATYNWPFRIVILTISIFCVFFTVGLACYMFHNRKIKVFKVSSPVFLMICLLGCGIMYLEMAAIFPILDTKSCIATKWTRHLGFCVTYTALLMKTWRVSLTYRVKSAHKVKLTDHQLLQWMVPILLVMLIYLSTWTAADPPSAQQIKDIDGLIFKQCSFNWWDHALAIGEVLFLLWGIKVCYNVRNAESLYNEAKLISYAIYNIAFVNSLMVAIHLFIFPQAGPDIKYLLGFIRTQLSTTTTVALVFGPKVYRVLRGNGDKWDNIARARGITASFCINGGGLMPEEGVDLYQENEELKEQIQKLAGQLEFMKIVQMEVNNRHIKPKPGGYFTLQSPLGKNLTTSRKQHHHTAPSSADTSKHENSVEDGHSGTNSYTGPQQQQQSNINGVEKV